MRKQNFSNKKIAKAPKMAKAKKGMNRGLAIALLVIMGFLPKVFLTGCPSPSGGNGKPQPRPRTNLEFATDWINEDGTALHPLAGRVTLLGNEVATNNFLGLSEDNPDVTLEELALLIGRYHLLTDLIPPFLESERGYVR